MKKCKGSKKNKVSNIIIDENNEELGTLNLKMKGMKFEENPKEKFLNEYIKNNKSE